MYLILNVGSTGTGKSTLIKEVIRTKRRVFVFDYQNEFIDLPIFLGKPIDKMRYVGELTDFMGIVEKLHGGGYYVVIEEASGLFESRIKSDYTKMLLSKRHTKTNYILNFHSLQDVPPKIWRYSDLLYMRKTNDMVKDVKKKFPQLLNVWGSVYNDKNVYSFEVVKLSNLTKNKNL